MNRLAILFLTWTLTSPLVALAADKNCPAQCDTQQEKCLKEAKTDKVKATCTFQTTFSKTTSHPNMT